MTASGNAGLSGNRLPRRGRATTVRLVTLMTAAFDMWVASRAHSQHVQSNPCLTNVFTPVHSFYDVHALYTGTATDYHKEATIEPGWVPDQIQS